MNKRSIVVSLLVALFLASTLIPKSASGAPPVQGLDQSAFRLIGTIEARGFIGAVLVDAKGAQTFYRLHEQLPDGSELVEVHSDHIVLKRSDGTIAEVFIAHDTNEAVPRAAPPPDTGSVVPEPAPERSARDRRQLKKKELKRGHIRRF